jgi:hypothetical protein
VKLAEWADGCALVKDPQRDDPVYYYARSDDLTSAVGFIVEPLHQEESRPNVTMSLAPGHRERANQLPLAARRTLFLRVFQTLVRQYPHWTSIKWKSDDSDREIAAELSAVMAQLGFRRSPDSSPHRPVWERQAGPSPTDDRKAADGSSPRALSIWLRLVAIFLVTIGVRAIVSRVIGEAVPILELVVSALAIPAGIAIWTRWRHAFMLTTASLALYTAATFLSLPPGTAAPERVKAALLCLTPYGVLLWRRRELEPTE